jgi:hypothetical protein
LNLAQYSQVILGHRGRIGIAKEFKACARHEASPASIALGTKGVGAASR